MHFDANGLLLASSIPFIFSERSQVFFAKARGRETLIYPAKIDLGSVEPGSEPIPTFLRSFRAAGAPFYGGGDVRNQYATR